MVDAAVVALVVAWHVSVDDSIRLYAEADDVAPSTPCVQAPPRPDLIGDVQVGYEVDDT